MKKFTEIKIIPLLLLALIAVSIFASVNYYNNRQTRLSNNLLANTHQVLYKSEKILSILKDVETGTRGFVITGDSVFLQPYYLSKDSIQANITALKILTTDNPLQQVRIDTLALLAAARIKMCSAVIQLRRNKNFEMNNVKILLEDGKKVMDNIRDQITTIQQEENRLLTKRKEINERNFKKSETTSFIFFGSILLLLAATFFASKYFNNSSKTQSGSLAQLNSRLILFGQRMNDVIKGISDPFFSLDKDFTFIFFNDVMQNTFGVGKGNFMGKNIFDVFPQCKKSITGKKMKEVMESKKVSSFEAFDDFLAQWQDITVYPTSEGIAVYIKDATKRKAYEKELHTTQQLLEETNQVAGVGGWEVDMQAGTVNWTTVTGLIHETAPDYKPDLKTGIEFYKPGKDRETVIGLINEAVEKGIGWDAELQIITARGNEKWIRTKGKAIVENGECVRLLGTFQDIDAQKKMADRIEQKEKQFRSAFENPIIGMALVKPDSKTIEVNQALSNITGYSKEELALTSFHDITHPEDKFLDINMLKEITKDPTKVFQYEKRYLHKQGHIVWIQLSVAAVTDSNDNVIYHIAQMQDISEKKLAEKKLKEERKLLQDIIDNLPLNLYMKDLHSRKILVNKSEIKYAGANSKEEILGKTDFELYPQQTAAISVAEDIEVINTKKAILNRETKSVKSNGTETTFLTSKIPFINERGKVTGLLGISYETALIKK